MIGNHLKVALRSLARHKGQSAVNVIGLTIGLTCFLLIAQYVLFASSFDRFHAHRDDVFRVLRAETPPGETPATGTAYSPVALGPALADAIPEVVQAIRVHPEYVAPVVAHPEHPERVFEESHVYYTDPAFFRTFTFPLVQGDEATALQPGTMLLTETTAHKYFGSEAPVGQVLDVTGWVAGRYRVAGILRDPPPNSHLNFDILLPMDAILHDELYLNEPEDGWNYNNLATYVRLADGADPSAVEANMTRLYRDRRGDALRDRELEGHLLLQSVEDVHLGAGVSAPPGIVRGSRRTVVFFAVVGLVTLLIALVNYVNLALARALDRGREVGVRKIVGARRRQLVEQCLCEWSLTGTIATVAAIGLATAAAPYVNEAAGMQIVGTAWSSPWFWAVIAGTAAAATVLAGLYPALVVSSHDPTAALRGYAGTDLAPRHRWRRGLVVLQFAVCIVIIALAIVVHQQLDFVRLMDVGLDLERVITVPGPRVMPPETDRRAAMVAFAQELEHLPGVEHVATSASVPGQGFTWNGAPFRRRSDDPARTQRTAIAHVDTGFAAVYGLELAAGVGLDRTTGTGTDAPEAVVANETAARALGFETPAEAIGEPLDVSGYDVHIVGVYRDFNWGSAREERRSVLFARSDGSRVVSLRVNGSDVAGMIATVEDAYDSRFPGNVFRYAFADEAFMQQYHDDQRFGLLLSLAASLAIGIACLGLLALAALTARRRTKEVGVRKVLGASVAGIVALLSSDVAKLVGMALAVALVPSYLLAHRWLQDFAFRVDLSWTVFLWAGAGTLAIALAAVSYHALRTALADPVDSLRYE